MFYNNYEKKLSRSFCRKSIVNEKKTTLDFIVKVQHYLIRERKSNMYFSFIFPLQTMHKRDIYRNIKQVLYQHWIMQLYMYLMQKTNKTTLSMVCRNKMIFLSSSAVYILHFFSSSLHFTISYIKFNKSIRRHYIKKVAVMFSVELLLDHQAVNIAFVQ